MANHKDPNDTTLELSTEETSLLRTLRALQYGVVEVTKHDWRIVQIQRTEKMRFNGDTKN